MDVEVTITGTRKQFASLRSTLAQRKLRESADDLLIAETGNPNLPYWHCGDPADGVVVLCLPNRTAEQQHVNGYVANAANDAGLAVTGYPLLPVLGRQAY